jgi:DNA polymerase III alpha subunit (gram-positive type)
MIACKLKNGRVIDFEGSKNSGIQQASYIDFVNFDIINYSEFLCSDGVFSDWLITNTSSYKIDYWVAHNANVEQNLIKRHTPYKRKTSSNSNQIIWGPWIDSLAVYKTLYPKLNDYSLQSLSSEFLQKEKIGHLVSTMCNRTGKRFHQSMYDCIITFLLLKRLDSCVDLNLFLS